MTGDLWLPRDLNLERTLTDIAARSAGLSPSVASSLCGYSDARAEPGAVRQRDMDEETRQELGDGRNYLLWGIQPIYDLVIAGDPQASADYERRMRTLARLTQAWAELHTPSR